LRNELGAAVSELTGRVMQRGIGGLEESGAPERDALDDLLDAAARRREEEEP
jgi:hypothetical protein